MRSHCNPCAEIKDGEMIYNFSRCLHFLEEKGKAVFGDGFRIYKEDHRMIYRLLAYMVGDQEAAERYGLSLKKGILLTGPIGCGKTSLMKLLRLFLPIHSRYIVKSCREVSFEFKKDGYYVISHYALNRFTETG